MTELNYQPVPPPILTNRMAWMCVLACLLAGTAVAFLPDGRAIILSFLAVNFAFGMIVRVVAADKPILFAWLVPLAFAIGLGVGVVVWEFYYFDHVADVPIFQVAVLTAIGAVPAMLGYFIAKLFLKPNPRPPSKDVWHEARTYTSR